MYNSQFVADRITDRLKAVNQTKAALNTFCGIDKSTINKSALSENGLSAKILYLCADYLGCSVDFLLGRTDTVSVGGGLDLSPVERDLIRQFRILSHVDQGRVLGRVEAYAELAAAAAVSEEEA